MARMSEFFWTWLAEAWLTLNLDPTEFQRLLRIERWRRSGFSCLDADMCGVNSMEKARLSMSTRVFASRSLWARTFSFDLSASRVSLRLDHATVAWRRGSHHDRRSLGTEFERFAPGVNHRLSDL